jgi:hypothetical protein
VLFTPDPGVRGAPAATFEYAATGYPLVLSATAAIVVPRRITPPRVTAAVVSVDGDPIGVTFLTLPVRGFDGPARAVVTAFPAGGDLYNVLPGDAAAAVGGGGAVRVGPAIPRRQREVSQLPAAVLNASGPDGALRRLAPGPWRGRLVHGRVVDCGACWVNASGAFPECAPAAVDGKGGDRWYAGCGEDGYEAVMVEYAQVRRVAEAPPRQDLRRSGVRVCVGLLLAKIEQFQGPDCMGRKRGVLLARSSVFPIRWQHKASALEVASGSDSRFLHSPAGATLVAAPLLVLLSPS